MSAESMDQDAVLRVLVAAAETARKSWRQRSCDIYHCVTRAWRVHSMRAPYASVMSLVRGVVPDGQPLAFNDRPGMTGEGIAQIFVQAALVRRQYLASASSSSARVNRAVTGSRPPLISRPVTVSQSSAASVLYAPQVNSCASPVEGAGESHVRGEVLPAGWVGARRQHSHQVVGGASVS